MRLTLPTIALVSIALASCASTGSPDRSETEPVKELASSEAQAPRDLDKPCRRPTKLPERALSGGETERYWGQDRAALDACGDRHDANVRWRRRRDAGLAGTAREK